MRTIRFAAVLAWVLLLNGCYAARVETGLEPSNVVIRKGFAACWIYGLVPPSTLSTQAQCPGGVAIVETKLSFVNQLVGALTLGIYTPMQIVVTCAQSPSSGIDPSNPRLELSEGATTEEVQAVFARAADEAVRTKQAVFVHTVP